ncbi:hypothetical protein PZB75_22090 [Streptomyces sp. AM 4-1-1]|uniref:hypothetical protein n=1 Tax=Streptomyces sp. AM 4-1-1 TaxID=3028710 RepID=UPI0023B91FD5|nr:hypothetical protein [Streptomyces sp. AM 4-1-1]WEH37754.1 hypothetical protein PZB75_22090 [Streptomyces sp. AM 4-1-1]
MKPMLWILLVAALAAGLYFTNFADLTGTTSILARVGSGVVAIGAGVGLWLTRSDEPA